MKRRTSEQRTRLDAHVFVCTNARDSDYACCADAGGAAVADAVRDWLRERNAFWSPVGVSTTTCLGLCSEDGSALTIQPRNEWFSDVRPDDVPELLANEFGPDAERL
ncbi:(2Fe-2S) ferredoxin domain-containing protein [Natronococcus sp. JC468]|uniref:(2Fe-2S) ferredoxin domain-containing protein n=1 Tax=Natronococcus sp. JC468 TaxID=1961921 RepID=UPI001438D1F3|nr:(2Fe-2S) ferredoxin domain-containing protein [Natronococcus sp. JC468]NKE35251.1 (2Fe-2S) ferredoxin domain-containing protein [Natronococcus sp. JC468]